MPGCRLSDTQARSTVRDETPATTGHGVLLRVLVGRTPFAFGDMEMCQKDWEEAEVAKREPGCQAAEDTAANPWLNHPWVIEAVARREAGLEAVHNPWLDDPRITEFAARQEAAGEWLRRLVDEGILFDRSDTARRGFKDALDRCLAAWDDWKASVEATRADWNAALQAAVREAQAAKA
jgi:hypothetical protein